MTDSSLTTFEVLDADGSRVSINAELFATGISNHAVRETAGETKEIVYQYLREYTDTFPPAFGNYPPTLGGRNATGNYFPGPTYFALVPPLASHSLRISSLLIHARSASQFTTPDDYCGLTLGTGVEIQVRNIQDGTLIQDLTDTLPVQSIADYARIGGVDVSTGIFSSGGDYMNCLVRFDVADSHVRLNANTDALMVVLTDNFSSLTDHTFFAAGFNEDVRV
jgi:hypothetical protein